MDMIPVPRNVPGYLAVLWTAGIALPVIFLVVLILIGLIERHSLRTKFQQCRVPLILHILTVAMFYVALLIREWEALVLLFLVIPFEGLVSTIWIVVAWDRGDSD